MALPVLPLRALFETFKPSQLWATKDTSYVVRISQIYTPNHVKLYGPLGCLTTVALLAAIVLGSATERLIALLFLLPALLLSTWCWRLYVLFLAKKLRQPTHLITDFLTLRTSDKVTKQDFFESVLMRYHHLGGCYATLTSKPGTFEDLGFEIISDPAFYGQTTKPMLRRPKKQEVATSRKYIETL